MANTPGNPSQGFQVYGRQEGAAPTAGLSPAWIASTDATLIFRGDPVVTSSLGGTNNSGNYVTAATVVGTNFPSTGWLVRGIFMGCEQFIPSVGRVVWSNFYGGSLSGSTGDIRCWLVDDPDLLFLVQASTVGGVAITSSMIGCNVLVSSNPGSSTGNQTTGFSNVTIATSIASSAGTFPFRLVDFYSAYAAPAVPAVGSAAFINGTDNTTPSNMVLVRFNNCDRLNLTARSV